MAGILSAGDFAEEARAALINAILSLGRALAVETRAAEPASTQEALLPPLALAWKDTLTPLRNFAADPAIPVAPLIAALERI
jgi:hypothetical protein